VNWDLIFKIANLGVLPFWLLLAFAPRNTGLVRLVFVGGSGLLALLYSVLIIGLMSGGLDGGGSGDAPRPDFTTLAGVMALFDTPGGATIGWIHYLAFDLFVGVWIARNADRHGINRIIQLPILFFTLMFGPMGLLIYLITRAFLGKQLENGFVPR
jgi:hypothetical protein